MFSKTKKAQVIGCRVDVGTIKQRDSVEILRRDEQIGRGIVRELQVKKQSVEEATEGSECGMKVETNMTLAERDVLRVLEQRAA